jgi:hypothetical protein
MSIRCTKYVSQVILSGQSNGLKILGLYFFINWSNMGPQFDGPPLNLIFL